LRGSGVDRLAGEGNFRQVDVAGFQQIGVADHAEHGGGGGEIIDLEFAQRLNDARRIELARISRNVNAEGQRRDGAVPQAMAPGGRGGAEVVVLRRQADAVQGRDHQRDHRAVRVLHRLRQLARGARGVLEYREVGGAGVGLERRVLLRQLGPEGVVHLHYLRAGKLRGKRLRVVMREDERGFAVIDAQRQPLRPEQREQRHADGAALHRAEQADIKPQRRLEDHRHPVALGDAAPHQPVGEAAGQARQFREAVVLCAAVGELDAHRRTRRALRVPVQALVRQVHALGRAVEQLPQLVPRKLVQDLRVAADVGDAHRHFHSFFLLRFCLFVGISSKIDRLCRQFFADQTRQK
jgi:hypothetical protein